MLEIRATAAVTAVVAALAAAGCGGDDDSEEAPSGEAATTETSAGEEPAGEGELAACDLITAEEAEEAIGKPVELNDQGTNSTFSVCNYQADAGDNFILTVGFGVGASAYESSVDALPASAGSKPEPVAGIGDEAVFVATGAGAAASSGAIYALAGDHYFTLSYSGDGDPEEVTSEAAEIAAGRL